MALIRDADVSRHSIFLLLHAWKISEKPTVKNIRQFQLLSWPDMTDIPAKRRHILELIERLLKWQRHLGIPSEEWKGLVHCS